MATIGCKRNTFNHSFFSNIDSEEKAYWLGFLYADGSIYKEIKNDRCRLELTLASKDINHLKKFNIALEATNNIYEKRGGFGNRRIYSAVTINYTSKQLYNDLLKAGCVPNKSTILKFPSIEVVPIKLQRHFIRGYFDGDGCFTYHSDYVRRKYNMQPLVIFCETKEFLKGILDIVNLPATIALNGNSKVNWAFRLQKKSSLEFILKYMFEDANTYLDRKHELIKTRFPTL